MSWEEDDELERFKKEIDLRVYAASQGYVLDHEASGPHSFVMRHPNGDKVVIRREAKQGHYEYFSLRDRSDNGSIIDFVQKRKGGSLGDARKELRPWIGSVAEWLTKKTPMFPALHAAVFDRGLVESAYAAMDIAREHSYLQQRRLIPKEVLQSKRFLGRIRIDGRGNAIFPHFDRYGLCGYEIKNEGFTGFSSGGTKGLWLSHQWPDHFRAELYHDEWLEFNGDFEIVFCESAIDALSHSVLYPVFHRRYASIGGQVSDKQIELIKDAISAMDECGMSDKGEVIAAMDADPAGVKLCDIVVAAFEASGRKDLVFRKHVPEEFKDWNEQLMAQAVGK